jgi:uncharacterized membrane protein
MRSSEIRGENMKRKQRQSGAALIMLTMMLATVMVPLVGLAIDGSIMFLIKTKLSASVDAAALAGARSLSVGMDIASQSSSAVATAQAFFDANFPRGYFSTDPAVVSVRRAVGRYTPCKAKKVFFTRNTYALLLLFCVVLPRFRGAAGPRSGARWLCCHSETCPATLTKNTLWKGLTRP